MSVLKNQTNQKKKKKKTKKKKKKKKLSDTVAFQRCFNYSFESKNSFCTQLPLTNKSILNRVQTELLRPFARS